MNSQNSPMAQAQVTAQMVQAMFWGTIAIIGLSALAVPVLKAVGEKAAEKIERRK